MRRNQSKRSINPSRGRNADNEYGFNRGFPRQDTEDRYEIDLRGSGGTDGYESRNPFDRGDEEFRDEDEQYLAQDYDQRDSERYRDLSDTRLGLEGNEGRGDFGRSNFRNRSSGLGRSSWENHADEFERGRGEHYGKGPRGWRRSDERIKEEVCDALFLSYDVDAGDIEVEVENGMVYLRGEVQNREEKRAAEDCVDNVSGVVDVINELKFNRQEPVMDRRSSTPENELGTRLA